MDVKLIIKINHAERLSILKLISPIKWGILITPVCGPSVNARIEGIEDKTVLTSTINKTRSGLYFSLIIINPNKPAVSTRAIQPINCVIPIYSKQKRPTY